MSINPNDLVMNAKSAILIECKSREVLFEKNVHIRYPMASLTKLMTLLLILREIDNGGLNWSEPVRVTERATQTRGSRLYLKAGDVLSVEDMFKAILISSANDAAEAMAEHICGSTKMFVRKMNKYAKKYKLRNTHYMNPHGLPRKNHFSTAFDVAQLAIRLVSRQEILTYSHRKHDYIYQGEIKKIYNTNQLLTRMVEVDGLKTGYTPQAGYCLAASARKNGIHLVAVILGEPSMEKRDEEMMELLNYGFALF
ncbi:D-alanyl-D-alanine carboxypeptidase family protein [Bacillus sp. Marseille-P3661]|uniref:D-alanyl-D-alanine carboxypeptidase family protein n=1 Tax=Bacillus sp. Marseille-P3661 TaxID=1936234 RepID=UPI000C856489|nr:D-alanyl-D-alanine carboxypeptidase family protein [Bacillus sp. Marseille-P3661]